MNDTRKLKWTDPTDPVAGEWLALGATQMPIAVNGSAGWCADPGYITGIETGATGRRCAESALVAAGVITQAEADELVWREYRPWAVAGRDFSSDDAGHGLTQEEWGEWADRRTALGISIDPWGWKGDSQ